MKQYDLPIIAQNVEMGGTIMLRAAIAFIFCFCIWCGQAEAKRVALVIGNSAYRSVSPLANPQNDARLVANALVASGFEVQFGVDLDRARMEIAIEEFAQDAMQADVAMVYFAGHGLEASGANWLLPVDANIRSLKDLPATSVPFEKIARSLAGATVKVVALDACRDNPFTDRLRSASGTINRGLAEVELDGYVVIYAAAAGQVALDGKVNSPFAQTLARWVGEQKIDLRLLAGKIRDDVIAATAGAQRPFVSASLPGKVTVLAPTGKGSIRSAALARTRKAYYFDYVRTLRDSACIPTREVTCKTKSMIWAAGRIVAVDDDRKLRVWDGARDAPIRSESMPVHPAWSPEVSFVASPAALSVTYHDWIGMIPLSGGKWETHTVEHGSNPQFLFTAGAPALAVYAHPGRCGFGFVDLGGFKLAGKTAWSPATACMSAEIAWSFPDPASDRFVARVTTVTREPPYKAEELILASYKSREIVCRVGGNINDAAFAADGDLYTAHDDGTILRHDRNCKVKQTYRLHQGAVEQIMPLKDGRMLSRSVDGALKLWSPETARVEKTMAGLSREAWLLKTAEDGSAALILNDKRLHLWYGEPRLGPYIGPSEPVCGGALSDDRDTLYALKCEGNVELWRRQRPD